MLSKRVLTKWRKEALKVKANFDPLFHPGTKTFCEVYIELNNRNLQMTQELLDQHLIKEKG